MKAHADINDLEALAALQTTRQVSGMGGRAREHRQPDDLPKGYHAGTRGAEPGIIGYGTSRAAPLNPA